MLEQYLRRIQPLSAQRLRQLGLHWFLDNEAYFTDELLAISQRRCDAFYAAGEQLVQMYREAAQFVIKQRLLTTLDIPPSMHGMIKYTYAAPRHLNLVGRFDLAGGIQGLPIKLLEYNANITTLLPETALIQREQLQQSAILNDGQFNYLQKDLRLRLQQIQDNFPYHQPQLLITTLGHPLDDLNADFIGFVAEEAGFTVVHALFTELEFSNLGISLREQPNQYFPFVYQSFGWEYLAYERADLLPVISDLVIQEKCIFLQPPYTMLLQNKGLLKYLWDLNPAHPLLLKTDFTKEGLGRENYVRKSIYGGEGENIAIYKKGKPLRAHGGHYGNVPAVYQDFAELAQDNTRHYYQLSLFIVDEPAAICFRRKDHLIVDEEASFMGHFIEADE
ncbi:MAG: glutathionylspermidine synthase family protein [Saprospiraceae bacterium]